MDVSGYWHHVRFVDLFAHAAFIGFFARIWDDLSLTFLFEFEMRHEILQRL